MIRPGEPIISDTNYADHMAPIVDGQRRSTGLVPRNYNSHPIGCYDTIKPFHAVDMPLIPESEWDARYDEMVATKSFLSDIILSGNNGQPIPSLDQNGKGYCWMHSGTGATEAVRALMGLPWVGLSAFAGACVIKHYQDEGGWGAQGVDFIAERGIPSQQFWPQQSMSRANDNPATWENAKLHRVSEGWIDLQAAQYDRKLSWQQLMTCLFLRQPVITDFNWWGHSVYACDPVRIGPGDWGIRFRNSWGMSYGDRGFAVLQGSKARPDGCVSIRVVTPSIN